MNNPSKKIGEMIKENVNSLYKVFILLAIMAGIHFLIAWMPNGENYQTRKENQIIKSCENGWFSNPKICEPYKENIISIKEIERGSDPEEVIPYCGTNNEKCELKGLKDYLNTLMLIIEFASSLLIGWMIGIAYTNKNVFSIKFTSWLLILSWHAIILMIIYVQNGWILFVGDISRQILGLIAFYIMLKINSPIKPKKKKKKK